jgi:peptidoglycan hydrolase-like protein with peptidoglycan-binding domain
VTFTARPAAGGPAVAYTYYSLDGGANWTSVAADTVAQVTIPAPADHTNDGVHTILYYSIDTAGDREQQQSCQVKVDTTPPVVSGLRTVTVQQGKSLRFAFSVSDRAGSTPLSPTVSVTLSVRTPSGRTVQTTQLGSKPTNSSTFSVWACHLAPGKYHFYVSAIDAAGNANLRPAEVTLVVTPPTISLRTVADVQRRLIALRYLPTGAVSGRLDYRTQQALLAFQAWNGLSRDGVADAQTKARLLTATTPRPRPEAIAGRYAEVFRSRGVLLLIDHGTVVRAVHVSTGRPGLETPAGRFAIYLKIRMAWTAQFQEWMPYASFFYRGDAIHQLADVPAYPASHGCVRMPAPEAAWVYGFLRLGTPVFVF